MKTETELTFTERHTMYNLLPLMARTAIVCVVPKAIDAIHDTFFKTKPAPKKALPPTRVKKRITDTTKFTKQHHDVICNMHDNFVNANKGLKPAEKRRVPSLVAELNGLFGLHKSVTSYSNIWTGSIRREKLPELKGDLYAAPPPLNQE